MQTKTRSWGSLKFNHLSPIKQKGRKRLGKYIVFDIETNDWKEFVVGGIYDGNEFKYYKTAHELRKALESYGEVKIFAHFGGIFDFLFILEDYGIHGLLDAGLDLVPRGSSLFTFKIGKLTFIDSCGILPFKLEKAAKAFGVSHQKLDIDHSKRKVLNKSLLKYLEHDCKALYECIDKYSKSPILEGANFKATLASQSLEILRRYLKRPIPSINNKADDDFIRQSYAGGRTEIFRPLYQSDKPLYYYDFNSIYPAVMHDMDCPGRVDKIHDRINEMTISDVEVEVPEGEYLPILWKKHGTKFLFPVGRFRGTFTGIELLEAKKHGVKILKVHKSMEFENLGKIFRNYVKDLYKMKSESKDPVISMIAKLLLNAGYGRCGIKRDREGLTIDVGQSGVTPIEVYINNSRLAKKPNFFGGFSNSAIASFVTAHARLKLFRAMKPIQDHIYYCDTDSIFTTVELPTGKGLGELKLEDKATEACFLLPKTYNFKGVSKLKGFPKEFAQSLNFENFAEALEGDLKAFKAQIPGSLARIKSAKGGSFLRVLPKSEKQLRHKYDKRTLFLENFENKSWNSRPLSINEV